MDATVKKYPSQQTAYASRYSKLYRCGHRLKVPALGYQRRIQALMAIGWSYTEIGARAGMTKAQLSAIVSPAKSDNRKSVHIATAKKIEAVYKELWLQPRHDKAAMKVKTWAKKAGYAPPLDWDDIDNDFMPYERRDEACGRNRHPASMRRQKPNGKSECVGCKNDYRERAAS